MPEADTKTEQEKVSTRSVPDFLKDLVSRIVPILLTAAGFLGFVTVIGGAIVWFRFHTAGLPPVQAIDALTRSELLVTGAVPLMWFGVLGLAAVAACYAIDRGGRPRESVVHSMIVLFGVAALFVLAVADELPYDDLVILGLLMAGWFGLHLARPRKAEDKEGRKSESRKFEGRQLDEVAGETPAEAPHKYEGMKLLLPFVAIFSVAAALMAEEWWALVAVLVAGALAVFNFRLAEGTGNQFAPFGVAVFFSIPLFAAVVAFLSLNDQPLVQPAALIASSDKGRLIVEGLYVTDDGKNVYLGSIATDGCPGELKPRSGTILAIPRSGVVAMRIGRLQTVDEAIRMAPSLTRLLVLNTGRFPNRPATKKPSRDARTPATAGGTKGSSTGTAGETKALGPPWPLRHSHDRAIRQEPRVERVARLKGAHATVYGDHFGNVPGRVVFGDRAATVDKWSDNAIDVTVPKSVQTSRVSVHCPDRIVRISVPTDEP